MKRLSAALLGVGLVLVLGCARRYEERVTRTLEQLKRQQRLDQFLNPADESLKELGIYLREPKPLAKADRPELPAPEGAYEVVARYIDSGGASAKGAGGGGIRSYVLARVKRPKKPTAKKGEEPQPEVARGEFVGDVRALLADYWGAPDFAEAKLETDKKGSNSFKRLIVPLQGTGETVDVKVYFFNQDNYEAALIWYVPASAKSAPANVTGLDLCLESFAVGPRALAKFEGGDTADEETGEPGSSAAGGTAF